jgi:hypothetical protein
VPAAAAAGAAGAAGQAYRAVLRCVLRQPSLLILCAAAFVSIYEMLCLAGKSQAGAIVAVLSNHVYLAALAKLLHVCSVVCLSHQVLCCSLCCEQAG